MPRDGASHGFHRTQRLPVGGYFFAFFAAGFLAAGFALFLVAMFIGSFLRYVSIIPLSLTPNNGLSSAITPKQPV